MNIYRKYLIDINLLRREAERLHALLEHAEELLQLQEQAEELHLVLERKRVEYRVERRRTMDAYDELEIGEVLVRIDDPTENNPPAATSASELRARLERHNGGAR